MPMRIKTLSCYAQPTPEQVEALIAGTIHMVDPLGHPMPHHLTTTEQHERLERAQRLGYLVRRKAESDALAHAYFVWCQSRGLPCVRVDTTPRAAAITVDWVGVQTKDWPSEAMCEAAAAYVREYAQSPGRRWPEGRFAHYGVGGGYWYIARVPLGDVEALAAQWAAICGTARRESGASTGRR